MEIGGFQRLSLIDYPNNLASIVFVTGCNMRCPFCHNPDLVFRNCANLKPCTEEQVLDKLEKASGFIEAVEITGGEPTLQKDLDQFIVKCRKLGLKIKLDTNGSNPLVVRRILDKKLIDYIAMDIKTELEAAKYCKAMGITNSIILKRVKDSIKVIMDSDINYEFRTTAVPYLVEPEDLTKIATQISGAEAYYIQQFMPGNCLDQSFSRITPYPLEKLVLESEKIKEMNLVKKCEVRGQFT